MAPIVRTRGLMGRRSNCYSEAGENVWEYEGIHKDNTWGPLVTYVTRSK